VGAYYWPGRATSRRGGSIVFPERWSGSWGSNAGPLYNYCVISKFEHHGRIDNRKLSGLVSRGWCIAHGGAWQRRRDIVALSAVSLYAYTRGYGAACVRIGASRICLYAPQLPIGISLVVAFIGWTRERNREESRGRKLLLATCANNLGVSSSFEPSPESIPKVSQKLSKANRRDKTGQDAKGKSAKSWDVISMRDEQQPPAARFLFQRIMQRRRSKGRHAERYERW